jgi:hypothetical protein
MISKILIQSEDTVMISEETAKKMGDDLFSEIGEVRDEMFYNNAETEEQYEKLRYAWECMTMHDRYEFLGKLLLHTAEYWG